MGESCLQKNQMGLESSVMVRFHSGTVVGASGRKIQPESKPPASGVHGLANDDCVTEWFPGAPENWKVMTVPFFAVTLLGMYWKIPP